MYIKVVNLVNTGNISQQISYASYSKYPIKLVLSKGTIQRQNDTQIHEVFHIFKKFKFD